MSLRKGITVYFDTKKYTVLGQAPIYALISEAGEDVAIRVRKKHLYVPNDVLNGTAIVKMAAPAKVKVAKVKVEKAPKEPKAPKAKKTLIPAVVQGAFETRMAEFRTDSGRSIKGLRIENTDGASFRVIVVDPTKSGWVLMASDKWDIGAYKFYNIDTMASRDFDRAADKPGPGDSSIVWPK